MDTKAIVSVTYTSNHFACVQVNLQDDGNIECLVYDGLSKSSPGMKRKFADVTIRGIAVGLPEGLTASFGSARTREILRQGIVDDTTQVIIKTCPSQEDEYSYGPRSAWICAYLLQGRNVPEYYPSDTVVRKREMRIALSYVRYFLNANLKKSAPEASKAGTAMAAGDDEGDEDQHLANHSHYYGMKSAISEQGSDDIDSDRESLARSDTEELDSDHLLLLERR